MTVSDNKITDDFVNKIEIHYIFRDKSHSMDAFTRNECEKEYLLIIREISSLLGSNIRIESEAHREGGLKEILKFISKYGAHITLALTLFEIIISRIPVENKDLIELQMENLRLDNEIKKTQLNEMKHKVQTGVEIDSETIERIVQILIEDYKIIWHRSNFYKKINLYHKIDSLSFQKLNRQNNPVERETVVDRPQFVQYILKSDAFPPNIDEDAIIDIISPVLTEGRFNWKGFYMGEIISFEMADATFRKSVLNKEVEFITGTFIKCVLHQTRKLDENGQVKVVHSKVITVFDIVTADNTQPFVERSKYEKRKRLDKNQLSLGF